MVVAMAATLLAVAAAGATGSLAIVTAGATASLAIAAAGATKATNGRRADARADNRASPAPDR